MLKIEKILALTALLAVAVSPAWAKVSAEEAARLGKDLTVFGAEVAGNADGTIPAYTGGITGVPEGLTYEGPGSRHPDPYADDKVLYSITAANLAEHADKVTAGQQALLKKYPDTYRIDVYPSRRSHAAPQWVVDNTLANATRATLDDEGVLSGAYGGIPFPITQDPEEMVWNHQFRWQGEGVKHVYNGYVVQEDGDLAKVTGGEVYESYPNYIKDGSLDTFNGEYWNIMVVYQRPERRKGEVLLVRDPVDQINSPRKAWQYLVGQRRVRRAPTVAYDTPNAGFSGLATYDDAFMFNGAMDRYDWKFVGKKEILIPYNCYKGDSYSKDPTVVFGPGHVNPDYVRWELHRVWVVEGTLKEDKRHIYGKRTFYLDEDSWNIALTDSYDGRGNLWRTNVGLLKNVYELPGVVQRLQVYYDLIKGQYAVNNCQTEEDKISIFGNHKPERYYTPRADPPHGQALDKKK